MHIKEYRQGKFTIRPICDSRQYRFGYRIRVAPDIPEGFSITLPKAQPFYAIFIPGDTEALWQQPEYPPRIYICTRDTLAVYSHSSSDDPPFIVPLGDLIEIDSQKILLYGAVTFYAGNASRYFRYKSVHQKHLNQFLRALRSWWLPSHGASLPAVSLSPATQAANFRCWYALQVELDPDEALHALCCHPPITLEMRGWLFKKFRVQPAILLAATSHRIIAISTGESDTNNPNGIWLRYAAPSSVEAIEIRDKASEISSTLKFRNGRTWQYAFTREQVEPLFRFQTYLERLIHTTNSLIAPDNSCQFPVPKTALLAKTLMNTGFLAKINRWR